MHVGIDLAWGTTARTGVAAVDADGLSGDGAGVMIELPQAFFAAQVRAAATSSGAGVLTRSAG